LISLYYLVVCLILLIPTFIIHELGHMLALRIFQVPIHRLTIGLGPTVFQKKLRKSAIKEVALKLFPFVLKIAFDIDHPRFQKLGLIPKILIFGMGVIVNGFIVVIIVLLVGDIGVVIYSTMHGDLEDVMRVFAVFNAFAVFANLLPISISDGGLIFNQVKHSLFPYASQTATTIIKLLVALVAISGIIYIYIFWV